MLKLKGNLKKKNYRESVSNKVPVWIGLKAAFAFVLFCFFFFFFLAATFDFFTLNSAPVYYSRIPQITLFSNFYIKNWSHSTIYTFKNYSTIVFSVSVFSFSKNKFNPNGPKEKDKKNKNIRGVCGLT